MAATGRRLLVLCVDRDNDVGTVLNVKTPLVGERAVLNAAVEYSLARPDDSDSNAMFAAVQTYRELRKTYGDGVEVALVAGLEREGVEGDMKILQELDQVLSQGRFDGVVLVSDGPTDEAVAPLIQSKLPIVSIRRVIVQQERGVEETFVLLVNYVKKAFTEENYKRYSLGLTGLFLVIYSLLSYFLPQFVWPILITALGGFMFFKGYNLGEYFSSIYKTKPITFASILLSIILSLLALIQGIYAVLKTPYIDFFGAIGRLLLAPVGAQLLAVDLLVLGAVLPFLGSLIDAAIAGKETRYSDALVIAVILMTRQLAVETARFLSGGGDIRGVLTWSFVVLSSVVVMVVAFTLERGARRQ